MPPSRGPVPERVRRPGSFPLPCSSPPRPTATRCSDGDSPSCCPRLRMVPRPTDSCCERWPGSSQALRREAMETIEILAAGAALFAVALALGWGVMRLGSFRRRGQRRRIPVPASWRSLIAERVPLTANLTDAEWDRLLELTGQFIRDKQFE